MLDDTIPAVASNPRVDAAPKRVKPMMDNGRLQKRKIEVKVELDDGTTMLASLFLMQQQRVSDLLNDDRRFLPLLTSDGIITNVRKNAIYRVTPMGQEVQADHDNDPFKILDVPETITDDELREVYVKLAHDYHPDRVQASGLSADFLELANTRMAKINDAYGRIARQRGIAS